MITLFLMLELIWLLWLECIGITNRVSFKANQCVGPTLTHYSFIFLHLSCLLVPFLAQNGTNAGNLP